jgi:hypothetical protein
MDRDSLHFGINPTARANLKRRVYDSINVMVASGIIKRQVKRINEKKEYFYKSQQEFSSELIK